jgi:L-asparagine oxygenase
MAESLRETVTRDGFALIPNFAPESTTVQAMGNIGRIVRARPLPEVHTLKPKLDAQPNTYSGNYGLGEFPLHSDLAHWPTPPRYFGLRCLSGAGGVDTRLFDGSDLINAVGWLRLQRTIAQPRRLLNTSRPLMRLLSVTSVGLILRWDELFVLPATSLSALTLKDVRQFLVSAHVMKVEMLAPGNTLIIDNWRMLHGRSSVSIPSTSRHLERVYLGDLP